MLRSAVRHSVLQQRHLNSGGAFDVSNLDPMTQLADSIHYLVLEDD